MIETKCSRIQQTDITTMRIADLRSRFSGKVISEGDPDYDQARHVFYGDFDMKPWLIVQAANVSDVAQAISLACDTGLELAVRSGGHSAAGYGVSEGGIVLDLKNLKGIEIDVPSQTAWAEAGLTAKEFTNAAAEYGLATGFGDTGSVGVGGITLGGGVGFLLRKYGLTIDNLLAAEVVSADGRILHVDAASHPDLFWAIRGGGGNFGVVTRFQFRLHQVDQVYGGMLILPALADVIERFVSEADAAPEELTTIANIMPAPPMPFIPPEFQGRLVLMAQFLYAGPPEKGEEVLKPFRDIVKPIADMVKPMRYADIYPPEGEMMAPKVVTRTLFLDRVDPMTAQSIVDHLQQSNAPMRVAQLRVLGGAMARVDKDATAFAHRDSHILANVAAFYAGPGDKESRQLWIEEFAKALHQSDEGAYVGFMSEVEAKEIQRAYPGNTWKKLSEVKGEYDPDNIFRLNVNIPPQ